MQRGSNSIFGWLVLAIAWLVLNGCGPGPEEACSAASPTPAAEEKAPPIRLQAASGSGVLILEEEGATDREPDEDDSLSEKPPPPLPPGHRGFRDHHVVLFVPDQAVGLTAALQAATASGGQVITYPIAGFEDLGPEERTLVFDSRTYPEFLRKIESLGEAEYSAIGPSDFVTVRLTVKEKGAK